MPATIESTLHRVASAISGAPTPQNMQQWFDEVRKMGESRRLRDMDRYERYFYGLQHDEKEVNWDGRPYVRTDQRRGAMLVGPGNVLDSPPPWQYRRPFIRRNLCNAIVSRFTGLLFGEQRVPRIRTNGSKGQKWIDTAIKEMDWYTRCSTARSMGGAVGSVVMLVKLIEGRPICEILNAQWCTPKWLKDDRDTRELEAIEVLYLRPVHRWEDVLDKSSGKVRPMWIEGDEWYRRIITRESDVAWTAQVIKDRPVVFKEIARADHNLGFVPAVWIKNTDIVGDDDGAPDCDQQWDNFDALDACYSDAFQGTHYNSDPTLIITSDRNIGATQLGSQVGIQLNKGEDAKLLELVGGGSDCAARRAAEIREAILEDVRCNLADKIEGAYDTTATHVLKREGAMLERADEFRRQYGDAMEHLFEVFLRMCRKVGFGSLVDPMASLAGEAPDVDDVFVEWPPYIQPTPADEELHIRKVATARTATPPLVSHKTAIRAVAHFLGIDDIEAEMKLIEAEEKERQEKLEALVQSQEDATDDDDDDEDKTEKSPDVE